jgi:hypothetical protein
MLKFPQHDNVITFHYVGATSLIGAGQLSSMHLGKGLVLQHCSACSTLPVNINDLMSKHFDSQSSVIALCQFPNTAVVII